MVNRCCHAGQMVRWSCPPVQAASEGPSRGGAEVLIPRPRAIAGYWLDDGRDDRHSCHLAAVGDDRRAEGGAREVDLVGSAAPQPHVAATAAASPAVSPGSNTKPRYNKKRAARAARFEFPREPSEVVAYEAQELGQVPTDEHERQDGEDCDD